MAIEKTNPINVCQNARADREQKSDKQLANLRKALREHNELSASLMRPLMKRSLAQITALEFANRQRGQQTSDLRLEIIADNCREMLRVCDMLERDGELADENRRVLTHAP